MAEPFQPRIEPGVDIDWMIPATVSDTQAVLYDGKMSVYLLGVQDQPKPHLAGLGQAALAKPLGAPPTVLGQTVFTVDVAGGLGVFALPALAHGNEAALGGRCAWGPGSRRRQRPGIHRRRPIALLRLEGNPPVAHPARIWPVGRRSACASARNSSWPRERGVVWRADAATGKELAKVDAGYPLATGPVLCGQKLLVGGHDGTLYEVRQP